MTQRLLAIHTGHNATAALMQDGTITDCTSEERFTRTKNQMGWPIQALKHIYERHHLQPTDITHTTIASTNPHHLSIHLHNQKAWTQGNNPTTTTPSHITTIKRLLIKHPTLYTTFDFYQSAKQHITYDTHEHLITKEHASRLQQPLSTITYLDHHTAHALSIASQINYNTPTLIFTLDGEGDELCATTNILYQGHLQRLSSTPKEASLGWLYGHTTRHLGMKANEHEFKVMGLAPYAKEHYTRPLINRMREELLDYNDGFIAKIPLQFADTYLTDHYSHERFDTIAGALQTLTEELIIEWIEDTITSTRIHDIALTGGVFMNVKANMRIRQSKKVRTLTIMPSSGDESLVYGCLYHTYKRLTGLTPTPFTTLYLGKEWNDKELAHILQPYKKTYNITHDNHIEEHIARLLAQHHVVARFNGRAEWGARALGNRSILAHPQDTSIIKQINEMIKGRDFWMPFTPTIRQEDEHTYINNPTAMKAPYMHITFTTTPTAQQHIKATLHPYDNTARPQVLQKEWNPSYHHIITAFKQHTGIGALLNTSFNLHGEPNVNSPHDALHTLKHSGLNYLAIGHYLIEKRRL